jgi:hypothetical protein
MTATTYTQYKQEESSTKITLAIMEASKRLVGWVVESGSIYRLNNFDVPIIEAIEELGTAYSEVSSLASVTNSTYYHDRANRVLYLRTSDDSHPNSLFLVLRKKLFFSDFPISLPFDLASGKTVFFEPLLKSTSAFGVELDNRNQLGVALEGSGRVSFINDADSPDTNSFWRNNYTKLYFENHAVNIYSTSKDLPGSEVKQIFSGRVKGKKYTPTTVSFTVQDLLSELRGEIGLANIEDIVGVRVSDNLLKAKQRRIYGRVFSHRPTNIDQVVNGYPITGTVTVTPGSTTVTGSGTAFLDEISPDDNLVINEVEVTVGSVTDNTILELTENFIGPTSTAVSALITPDKPKNFINRIWKVAGHTTRQPETTITNASSLNFFQVVSTLDMIPGDQLFIGPAGTGELATVQRKSGTYLKLEENILQTPSIGTSVIRPSVQNVKINNTALRYDRDFTYDADAGVLTLKKLAEFNIAPIRDLVGSVTFNGTRTVTGTSTLFDFQLQVGMYVRLVGEFNFFEISSIESPTSLTLKTVATYSGTGSGNYKPVINFNPGTDVLTCDCLGLTSTGAKDGTFLSRGPQIVKHLIEDAGVTDIDTASFTTSNDLAETELGLVVPDTFSALKTNTFRKSINRVNKSIFGSLIQNNTFQLQYVVLSPQRDINIVKFREFDVIKFSIDTTNEYMAKNVIVEYKNREYNPAFKEDGFDEELDNSKIGQFILRTDRTTRVETLIAFQKDAIIFARRWRHVLEIGHSVIKLTTKMQGMDLQVTDRLELLHQKMYDRIGGGLRKVSAIQGIRKSGNDVEIELEDLADAFSQTSTITENTALDFDNSNEDEKGIQGYITDNDGLINNDENTFRLHRIW